MGMNWKKEANYLFFLFSCVQALSACGNSPEVTTGKTPEESFGEDVSEAYGMEFPGEGDESTEKDGLSGQENAEEPDEPDSSVEALPEDGKKAFPEEDTVFDHALPVTGMFSLFKQEGESGVSRVIYDKSVAEKIVADILEVSAERAEDWTPEMAALPIYEITVWGAEGRPVSSAWSSGYWFSPNGVPYQFDYDFETLIASYDWDEQRTSDMSVTSLQWEWFSRDGWYPYKLWPAEEPSAPQEGLTVDVISMEDNILTIEIINNGEESWLYGEMFDLDLLLDGVWYNMLPLPDAWGFDDHGLYLGSGESVIKGYDFTMYYGVLPEGKYRLCISGDKLSVEFAVE